MRAQQWVHPKGLVTICQLSHIARDETHAFCSVSRVHPHSWYVQSMAVSFRQGMVWILTSEPVANDRFDDHLINHVNEKWLLLNC